MESTLILGAGCFWGVEVLFEEMPGVSKVIVGYSGGQTENPSYEQVCTGQTGHIEVVKIDYDSSVVSFVELLDKFFFIHDPTTVNRQGPDVGQQYMSVIFYNTDEEKNLAEQKIKKIDASGEHASKVVTEVREAVKFYPAEEYHQDYVEKNGKVCYHQLFVQHKNTPIPD
jgi:peptide-methionine (S)-S-oxide reductase